MLGDRIKQYRTERNMKQSDLAELSGVSRIAIGNYERGIRQPSADTAKHIANALKISLDDLLENHFITYGKNGEVFAKQGSPNFNMIEDDVKNEIVNVKRKLNLQGLEKTLEYMLDLLESKQYRKVQRVSGSKKHKPKED
jgi:transcriptional regulator with XRE-family HTH domain